MAENETSADPGLQLKKRARRRLVGAAALALLAVIVLPMVMDHEPRPPVQDIQVRIPSQDSEGLAASILSPAAAPNPLPPIEPKAAVAAAPVPKGDDSSGASATESPPSVPAAPPDPKAAAIPAAVEPGATQQWVVHLGAYKNAANVKQLLAKLKAMNLPVHTEKIELDQGARMRVKAGPFPSREAAEKAQARIKKIGVTGTVAVK